MVVEASDGVYPRNVSKLTVSVHGELLRRVSGAQVGVALGIWPRAEDVVGVHWFVRVKHVLVLVIVLVRPKRRGEARCWFMWCRKGAVRI